VTPVSAIAESTGRHKPNTPTNNISAITQEIPNDRLDAVDVTGETDAADEITVNSDMVLWLPKNNANNDPIRFDKRQTPYFI
jgi:hypothetical protein